MQGGILPISRGCRALSGSETVVKRPFASPSEFLSRRLWIKMGKLQEEGTCKLGRQHDIMCPFFETTVSETAVSISQKMFY